MQASNLKACVGRRQQESQERKGNKATTEKEEAKKRTVGILSTKDEKIKKEKRKPTATK